MKTPFFRFSIILMAGLLLIGLGYGPTAAQEFDELLCDNDLASLEIGEEFFEINENPLIMAGALVHTNRITEGSDIQRETGCFAAVVEYADGDRLFVVDFATPTGPYSSRYQFILEHQLGTNNLIALNSFDDVDAIAHELGYAPEAARVYHLDQLSDEEIRIFKFFVGEPSVSELLKEVSDILSLSIEPKAMVVLGEEIEIILSEEFFEDE